MGRVILKVGEDKYLEWTTVCDAPVSFGMTKETMQEAVRESIAKRNPDMIVSEVDRAAQIIFDRVEKYGTSSSWNEDAQSMIGNFNRAGYDESFLTFDEIVRIYCDEQREPKPGEGKKDIPVEDEATDG